MSITQEKKVTLMNMAAQIISLEDAAQLLSSGDGVWVGSALDIENPLIELLAARGEGVRGLTLVGSSRQEQSEVFSSRYSGAMRVVSVRGLCRGDDGRESTATLSDAQLCGSICGLFGINTVALRLSRPDADGFCSVSPDTAALTAALCADKRVTRRIAMLDLALPPVKAGEGAKISIKDFDFICSYSVRDAAGSSIA